MKYWLLTTEYPPAFGGGIGTYCSQFTDLLSKKGNDVTVFLPNRSVKDYLVKKVNGIRIIEFSPYFKDTSAFLGYETMQSYSFAEILRLFIDNEGEPDWVEAQEYNGIAYFILQRKQLGEQPFNNLKVLITCHAPSFLYFEFNHVNTSKLPYFWIGEMEKFCILAADVCISPSQYLIDRINERIKFKRVINVVHNPYVKTQATSSDVINNKAIFLAKLSPSKGVIQTLNTFKQLWNSGYEYKLKLIGDRNFYYHAKQSMMGKLIEEDYKEYINKGYLEIAGSMSPDNLQREISEARIILVPSTVDNFPYTVLESMANKKVVLASKQGGHQEIIKDGFNGLLFDHDIVDSFYNKVHEAFTLSEADLIKIGDNASATIYDRCNPEGHYEKKIGILSEYSIQDNDTKHFRFLNKALVSNTNQQYFGADKDAKGLLSVVIPYYNMGKYIDETIESILSSSYKELEIIIVNDGTTDALSLEKLQEIKSDSKLKIISQPNRGLANARNVGAKEAKGEFLAFLDADDKVHSEYYSRAITILQNKLNVHFVACWVQYFEGSLNVWPSLHPEPPYLLYHNMVNSSGLVYKKDSFLKAGYNDVKFVYGMEDYDSVINLVKNGFNGVVIPDILFFYRVRKGSMARGFNPENKSYLYQLLAEKHKDIYSIFATEISNLLNANGPGFMVENPTMDYHLFGNGSANNRYTRKIHSLIKKQPFLRKIALAVYSKIK